MTLIALTLAESSIVRSTIHLLVDKTLLREAHLSAFREGYVKTIREFLGKIMNLLI